jgi:hypothetical protein
MPTRDGVVHGFTLLNGQFTAFNVPGALGTFPRLALTTQGEIVGSFTLTAQSVLHGFLLNGADVFDN